MKKRYIVKKYVMALSATEAAKIAKTAEPDEVYLDDEWMKKNEETTPPRGL